MNGPRTAGKPTRSLGQIEIAGIRVGFDITWFIVFALVLLALSEGFFPRYYPGYSAQTYWLAGFVATLLFFASVVVHELAHSLMAVRSGIPITEITLFIFGGVSRITEEPKDPITELKIALVGPLSSFGLAIAFWIIRSFFASFDYVLLTGIFSYLAWINLALGIFNLVPGFPLDGGRVFRALYWWRTGSLTQATRVAADLGKGFAVALMVLGGVQIFLGDLIGGLWFIFIGMFLRGMSQRGYDEVITRKSLEDVPVKEVMTRQMVTVPEDITLAQLVHDYFLHYTYHGFPVEKNGEILGIVSLSGVRGVPVEEQTVVQVRDFIIPRSERIMIDEDASLAEALKKMTAEEQDRLLVTKAGEISGMITRSTLLRFVEIKKILEPETMG